MLIGQVINILIACFLAVIFNSYMTVIVYLAAYIPLRSYAGGHHADSYGICTLISTIILCTVCLIARITPAEFILLINIIGMLVSGGFIFVFAPVQDHNKPLEPNERNRYKKLSRLIWIMETCLWISLYYLGARDISLVIMLSHLSITVLLYVGIVKNKKKASPKQTS